MLGNTQRGDGQRFLGRGFIQVTGRYNYGKFAQNSGIDVVTHPELLEKPNTAAKATVDFWLKNVRPNVNDFTQTGKVTKIINHAGKGAAQRAEAFKHYASKLPQQPKKAAPTVKQPKLQQPQLAKGKQAQKQPVQQAKAPVQPKQTTVAQNTPTVKGAQKGDMDAFLAMRGLK
jgi:hypothetical protein